MNAFRKSKFDILAMTEKCESGKDLSNYKFHKYLLN